MYQKELQAANHSPSSPLLPLHQVEGHPAISWPFHSHSPINTRIQLLKLASKHFIYFNLQCVVIAQCWVQYGKYFTSLSYFADLLKFIRDDTHMTSMKIVQSSRPTPPCPSMSKILPPPWTWTSHFKHPPLPPTPPTPQFQRKASPSTFSWLYTVVCAVV